MTSSPHDPDERDLLDFADAVNAGKNPQPTNDLERTYLHVQRALQGESAAIPPTTKQSTWEDVMSTLGHTPPAPVSNRTRRQQQLTSPPRPTRPRRMQWTPLASIAAAALVIMASFGFWMIQGESGDPPTEPMQVTGLAPISGDRLQLATTAPQFACDFSQDMPIFEAESGAPTQGTTIVWQKGGDVYVHCDEAPEGILLASGVQDVGPVEGIPGMIVYTPVSAGDAAINTYLNITNGESFETGDWNVNPGFVQQGWGEFAIGHTIFVNDPDHKLVALDTRTMQPQRIEDLFGSGTPESFNLMTAGAQDSPIIAMSLLPLSTTENSDPAAFRGYEIDAPGDILLFNTETGETSWLTVPGDTVQLRSLLLSPDGSKLALELEQGEAGGSPVPDIAVMVLSIDSGEVLATSDTFDAFMFTAVWADSGLVVQANMDVLLLPFDGTGPQVLYTMQESATTLQGLQSTLDPNIVTVNVTICDGECKVAEADNSVLAINVVTGETKEFDGINIAYVTWESQSNLLVMTDPSVTLPDTTTYTVIDPISGETVAELPDMPGIGYVENQRPLIGPNSIQTTKEHELTVVAVSMRHMIELRSDGTEHSARLLPAPGRWADEGAGTNRAEIFLASDGSQLSAMSQNDESNGRFLLDLTDPNAEWSGSETDDTNPGRTGYTRFVEGVPAD